MSNRQLRKLREEAKQYKFAGNKGFGVSAQVAGSELDRIHAKYGHVKSTVVVDEARPEDSALHPAFEWNDYTAAERYRRHQASTLVRAVIVVPPEQTGIQEHRAYVLTTIPSEEKPVYIDAEKVVNSAAMFADAISRLERRLSEARASVRELSDLAAQSGSEPERMARIALAMQAIEAAGAAVAGLQH